MTTPRILEPRDLRAAIELLEVHAGASALLAGGVSWMLRQVRGEALPPVLLSLAAIDGLADVAVVDDDLVIGAMTRLAALERSAIVAERAPGLIEAIEAVGTVRIRSQVTIGGNLAAGVPSYDPPPMLIALDARVRLASPRGTREQAVDGWSQGPPDTSTDEILIALVVPSRAQRSAARYRSIDGLTGGVSEHAAAAVRIDLGDDGAIVDARIVSADASAAPRRCGPAEARLIGQRPDADAVDAAAALVAASVTSAADDDDAAGADRQALIGVATRRALLAAFTDLAAGPSGAGARRA